MSQKVSEEEKKSLDLSSLICAVNGADPVHYENVKEFNDYFADCGLQPNAIRQDLVWQKPSLCLLFPLLCMDCLSIRSYLKLKEKLNLWINPSPVLNQKQLVNLGKNMDFHELVIQDLETKEALRKGRSERF